MQTLAKEKMYAKTKKMQNLVQLGRKGKQERRAHLLFSAAQRWKVFANKETTWSKLRVFPTVKINQEADRR